MRQLLLHSTPMLLGALGFAIACCVTVRYTMARTMPEDGIYHIGPRQLGSAGLLGAIFVFQFFSTANQSARRAAAIGGSRTVDADPVFTA